MKILKYFILVLFVCSVFSSNVPAFAKDNKDHDLWYKEHQLLMLKQEKNIWKSLKDNQAREDFIWQFWKARDPDTFTLKNELRSSYERNLIEVRKDYSNLDDVRRCVHLLYGKPDFKRFFADQAVVIPSPSMDIIFRIRIAKGEIWKYNYDRGNFQVIFAKLSPYELQRAKDYYADEEFSSMLFLSSRLEILYIGPAKYVDVSGFVESFFQEGISLQTTSKTIDDLKKQILDRAKDFYKGTMPKVKKERYPYDWKQGDIRVLIHPFEINSPKEAGIGIWLSFDRDALEFEKKQYLADLSLFCEIRDSNGKRVIYYQEDGIEYKLKEKKDYYYHFWGSLAPGKYKLILEIGENIGKRYKKFEIDVILSDYSVPGLKANLLIGKAVKDSDNKYKGKLGYFSLEKANFCPILGNQHFRDEDDLIAIFDVAGFKRNNYGDPHVELTLLFTGGKIEQGKFVPTSGAYAYQYAPLEEADSYYRGILKIKIRDLIEKLRFPSGLYKIGLLIRDRIAGKEGVKEFPRPIHIISVSAVAKESINN